MENVTNSLIAYVDGSYDKYNHIYGYGCFLLLPNGKTKSISGNGWNEKLAKMRNITGEILGAMTAVQWAVKNHYPSIDIYYDYYGIEKWVTGKWNANNPMTRNYVSFMLELSKKIIIIFHKVSAHSGDVYNDRADALAKEAILKDKHNLTTIERFIIK